MIDSQTKAPNSEQQSSTPAIAQGDSADTGGSKRVSSPIRTLIWAKRRAIRNIVIAGTLLTVIYSLVLPNMYTSTTTLLPPENPSSSSNLLSLLSTVGAPISAGSAVLGLRPQGALFTGILGSRTVLEALVNQFGLVGYYRVRNAEDACRRLAADTTIQEAQKSGIITISVTARSPALASSLAQAYVVELDRVVTNNSTSAAHRERVFLEGRLKEIKQDLDDSSKSLSQFSSKNRTIDVSSQAKAMLDAGLKEEADLAAARSELAALKQIYSDDNVRVRAASARVDELQRQLNELSGQAGGSGGKGSAGDPSYPSVAELPTLGLTFEDLSRKVLVEQTLWEALTKQYEAAKVEEAKEIPTVRVLDPANVPQRKSGPARSAIVILGAMTWFFIACMFVVGARRFEENGVGDRRSKVLAQIFGLVEHPFKWLRRVLHARKSPAY